MPLTLDDLQKTTGTRLGMPFVRGFIQQHREEMRCAEAEDRRLGNLPSCDRCKGFGMEPHSADVCWACNGTGEPQAAPADFEAQFSAIFGEGRS